MTLCPMSDRASRDLARQRGHRAGYARGAPHTIGRAPAHTQPGTGARLEAQCAQLTRLGCLYLAHTCTGRHTQSTHTRRAQRAAARPAAASRPGSRQSRSPIGLRTGGCEWGTREDTNHAPKLEWLQQWSVQARVGIRACQRVSRTPFECSRNEGCS